MKSFFWFMAVLLLSGLLYIAGTGVLLRSQQTDILLIISILASTISMWAIWYAFLKRYFSLILFLCALLFFSLWLVYTALLDVINPTFM